MNFLYNSIGKWRLNRAYAKLKRVPRSISFNEVDSVVLVGVVNTEDEANQLIGVKNVLFKNEGVANIHILAYFEGKETPSYFPKDVHYFSKQDLNFIGEPKNPELKKLLKKDFDLLLDFTPNSFFPTDYFLALLHAKSKVGSNNSEKEYIFDLIIENASKTGVLDLSKIMIRYLKMLNLNKTA